MAPETEEKHREMEEMTPRKKGTAKHSKKHPSKPIRRQWHQELYKIKKELEGKKTENLESVCEG